MELFYQRFNRARYLCFQLFNSCWGSAAHLELPTHLNEQIHSGVSYSDLFRNQLGSVPDSNNNMSLLDKHGQKVQDIQKPKHIVLSISNTVDKVCLGFLPPLWPSPSSETRWTEWVGGTKRVKKPISPQSHMRVSPPVSTKDQRDKRRMSHRPYKKRGC